MDTEEELPVRAFRDTILKAVQEHQIVIIIGETGSGKTTQLPQFLLDGGYLASNGVCVITQPRRVAAQTVARRVASERGCRLGDEVGYCIRFDDQTSANTRLKFVTDGVLVQECLSDPLLRAYAAVMLDEAHERSLNTDLLFGLIKRACALRSDLKVLITSATLNADKFSAYFNSCPVLHVPGRVFPVEIYHSKTRQVMTRSGPASNGYIDAAVDVVLKIHRDKSDVHVEERVGHVLVFLTGRDDIESAANKLRNAAAEDGSLFHKHMFTKASLPDPSTTTSNDSHSRVFLVVIPLYGALSGDDQQIAFENVHNTYIDGDGHLVRIRKCIIATNIAETSITVPFVRYVVDAGFVKQKAYDPQRRVESLVLVPISKVSAAQRAGRSGRTGAGQCYRLYSEECLANMIEEAVPEIQRTNLTNTVLHLKVLGINDVLGFDFIDAPSSDQLCEALVLLHILRAIDDTGHVTPLGRDMSRLPVEPAVSCMLVHAIRSRLECVVSDALAVAAMLSVEQVWVDRPSVNVNKSKHRDASQDSARCKQIEAAHEALRVDAGDHFTLLNVFNKWQQSGNKRDWCEKNFVKFRALETARNIKDQLQREVSAVVGDVALSTEVATDRKRTAKLSEAIANALYMNAARRCSPDAPIYRSFDLIPTLVAEGVRLLHLHPDSSLGQSTRSEFVVYQELVHSSKVFMRNVVSVDGELLIDLQRRWKHVHPFILSERIAPALLTVMEDTTEHIVETVARTKAAAASQTDLDSARQRFLKRKAGLLS